MWSIEGTLQKGSRTGEKLSMGRNSVKEGLGGKREDVVHCHDDRGTGRVARPIGQKGENAKIEPLGVGGQGKKNKYREDIEKQLGRHHGPCAPTMHPGKGGEQQGSIKGWVLTPDVRMAPCTQIGRGNEGRKECTKQGSNMFAPEEPEERTSRRKLWNERGKGTAYGQKRKTSEANSLYTERKQRRHDVELKGQDPDRSRQQLWGEGTAGPSILFWAPQSGVVFP